MVADIKPKAQVKTIDSQFIMSGNRYKWDWELDWSAGWCQLDSGEDAWYYGNWVNLQTYEWISYMEGDFDHKQAATREDFVILMARLAEVLHKPVSLDTMCVEANDAAYTALGLDKIFTDQS